MNQKTEVLKLSKIIKDSIQLKKDIDFLKTKLDIYTKKDVNTIQVSEIGSSLLNIEMKVLKYKYLQSLIQETNSINSIVYNSAKIQISELIRVKERMVLLSDIYDATIRNIRTKKNLSDKPELLEHLESLVNVHQETLNDIQSIHDALDNFNNTTDVIVTKID
jgi:sulfatase maturation enzyme AslB (radical SAM superfamily)